jgi:hypothetical protein
MGRQSRRRAMLKRTFVKKLVSVAFRPDPDDEYRPGFGSVAAMIQLFAYMCFKKLGSISIS